MSLTDGLEIIDPRSYAAKGYPHAAWTQLRREAPVHRCEPPGWRPFWAVSKHADICEISRQPERFVNGPRMALVSLEAEAASGGASTFAGMRTVINMDGREHRDYRKIASGWFTPNSLRRIDREITASARRLVDRLAQQGECDFVNDIAAPHPLRIICRILGVAEQDEPFILKVTNELFGSEDPEFKRGADRQDRVRSLGAELYRYFSEVIAERRARPGDDLASVLANARLDGKPMGEVETLGYYLIVFTAGHETTRGGLSGGMLSLIEHPDQRERLRRDPTLLPGTINEILRWVTPVNCMARTATGDYRLRGREIRKDDTVVMFYASANRDEEVFDDPFSFRIDRSPNPHLAFGIGEHFCMGSNLARRSMAAFFEELVPRLEHAELAGAPERMASNLVPGLKHMRVRCRVTARKD